MLEAKFGPLDPSGLVAHHDSSSFLPDFGASNARRMSKRDFLKLLFVGAAGVAAGCATGPQTATAPATSVATGIPPTGVTGTDNLTAVPPAATNAPIADTAVPKPTPGTTDTPSPPQDIIQQLNLGTGELPKPVFINDRWVVNGPTDAAVFGENGWGEIVPTSGFSDRLQTKVINEYPGGEGKLRTDIQAAITSIPVEFGVDMAREWAWNKKILTDQNIIYLIGERFVVAGLEKIDLSTNPNASLGDSMQILYVIPSHTYDAVKPIQLIPVIVSVTHAGQFNLIPQITLGNQRSAFQAVNPRDVEDQIVDYTGKAINSRVIAGFSSSDSIGSEIRINDDAIGMRPDKFVQKLMSESYLGKFDPNKLAQQSFDGKTLDIYIQQDTNSSIKPGIWPWEMAIGLWVN